MLEIENKNTLKYLLLVLLVAFGTLGLVPKCTDQQFGFSQ